MLQRVWIDNFKTFVNFELRLGQQQLILGLNGSGKSTFLEVLSSLRRFSINGESPELLFPQSSCTRWQGGTKLQGFELEVAIEGSTYLFRLELERWGSENRVRVKREAVLCDDRLIFDFVGDEVHLFNAVFEAKIQYPFESSRSALATIQSRTSENPQLMKFKFWLNSLICIQINPHAISERSESEYPEPPAFDFSNFASWYRHMSQERGDRTEILRKHLKQIIPGFLTLDSIFAGGSVRILRARFAGPSLADYSLGFDDLSDGQRALICLYALLDFVASQGACIIIDEPENYIALSEIQPWILEMRECIDQVGGQFILTSHNPEVINYLAPELGIVFERDGPGLVRVHPYFSDSPLAPAEQMVRGWQ